MAQTSDHYQTLGVGEEASADDIKQAYRRLAKSCHPDLHPGDATAAERFKTVQHAYEVLSDPPQRRAYDRLRRDPFATYGGAFAARDPSGSFASDPALSDLFDENGSGGLGSFFQYVFGADEVAGRAAARGRDVETQVRLSFDESLRGGRTEVRLPDGETLRLTIPQGVRSGLKVRVHGVGSKAPPGGEPGDLYVTFRVDPSARFRREGDHLHVVETISAMEAMLGATRAITNAYGKTIKVHVPPGTQPGERLRLRGQGVVTAKHTGDLLVEIHVSIPRNLTDAQRAALDQTARDLGIL